MDSAVDPRMVFQRGDTAGFNGPRMMSWAAGVFAWRMRRADSVSPNSFARASVHELSAEDAFPDLQAILTQQATILLLSFASNGVPRPWQSTTANGCGVGDADPKKSRSYKELWMDFIIMKYDHNSL